MMNAKERTKAKRQYLQTRFVYTLETKTLRPFLSHIIECRAYYETKYNLIHNTRITADGLLELYKAWHSEHSAFPSYTPSRHTIGKMMRRIFGSQITCQRIFCMPGIAPPAQARKAYVFDHDVLSEYLKTSEEASHTQEHLV